MIQKLEARYLALSERDQKALKLACLCIPILTYLLLVKPAYDFYQTGKAEYLDNVALLQWMHQQSSNVTASKTSLKKPLESTSLIQLVSETAETHHLSFERMQPEGNRQLRIYAEKISFENLLNWLQAIQDKGVILDNLRIEKAAASGQVSFQGTLSH